jgi:hypothetical protein
MREKGWSREFDGPVDLQAVELELKAKGKT